MGFDNSRGRQLTSDQVSAPLLLARKLVLPLCLKVKPSASSFPLSRPADGGKRAPEAGRAEASQLWPQTRRREAARGVAPLVRTLCRCASRQEATKHSGPHWKVLNWTLCSDDKFYQPIRYIRP